MVVVKVAEYDAKKTRKKNSENGELMEVVPLDESLYVDGTFFDSFPAPTTN